MLIFATLTHITSEWKRNVLIVPRYPCWHFLLREFVCYRDSEDWWTCLHIGPPADILKHLVAWLRRKKLGVAMMKDSSNELYSTNYTTIMHVTMVQLFMPSRSRWSLMSVGIRHGIKKDIYGNTNDKADKKSDSCVKLDRLYRNTLDENNKNCNTPLALLSIGRHQKKWQEHRQTAWTTSQRFAPTKK